jgi:hypothetical protein
MQMRSRGKNNSRESNVLPQHPWSVRLVNASLQAMSLDLSRAEAVGHVLQALSTQVSVNCRHVSCRYIPFANSFDPLAIDVPGTSGGG